MSTGWSRSDDHTVMAGLVVRYRHPQLGEISASRGAVMVHGLAVLGTHEDIASFREYLVRAERQYDFLRVANERAPFGDRAAVGLSEAELDATTP